MQVDHRSDEIVQTGQIYHAVLVFFSAMAIYEESTLGTRSNCMGERSISLILIFISPHFFSFLFCLLCRVFWFVLFSFVVVVVDYFCAFVSFRETQN